jgi:hypothetical protein
MSDGFPLRSCVDVFLSHGEVVEVGDRFLASVLVSGRDHRTGEGPTRRNPELKVLLIAMRVGQSMVVPGLDGGRSKCSRRR